jgi:putative ABC transport system substrate-binding protein
MTTKILRVSLLIAALCACGSKKDDGPKKSVDPVGSAGSGSAAPRRDPGAKLKFLIVSSYHAEYLWSQDTNKGVMKAMRDFGYLDSDAQVEEFTNNSFVETPKAVVKKLWMDTKRKTDEASIAAATKAVLDEAKTFQPDILLLGDDNAANFVGNQFLDTPTPVVFWGINGLPVKYGLIEMPDKPGHNITGIYQAGYLKECVELLKKIVPGIKTMAVIADDSETGRAKVTQLQELADSKALPLELVGSVVTNKLEDFQSKTLEIAKKADAIFLFNHNTLVDKAGKPIDQLEVGAWYFRNVKKPDCGDEKQFAEEGVLATVDDSGFKQGYEAMKMAHDILGKGTDPGSIPVRAPERGALIANRERAAMLGIKLTDDMGIEEYVEKSLALEKFPK